MPSSSISFLASPEIRSFIIRMADLPAIGLHSSQLRPIEPGVNHPLAQPTGRSRSIWMYRPDLSAGSRA